MYDGLQMVQSAVFWLVLVWSSAADMRARTIPNVAIAIALVVRLVCCAFVDPSRLPAVLGSGMALVLPALLLAVLLWRISGDMGLGGGDLKLLFVVGCYLGVFRGAVVLGLGCGCGVLFCLARRALARGVLAEKDATGFPLAPFLALGCLVVA